MFFDNRISENVVRTEYSSVQDLWPSYKGRMVDALVPEGDERRGKLR
jgi:hypothetical protein